MSYPVINPKPHFLPFDICREKKSGELVIIREVNLNTSQDKDQHQWSYAIMPIVEGKPNVVAWYDQDELELVNNLFGLLADATMHPFSSSKYEMPLHQMRRS